MNSFVITITQKKEIKKLSGMDTNQIKEYGITAAVALVAALLFIVLAKPLGYAGWVQKQFQA